MKNCEGCDNMLSEDAEICYVCYARVGEGVPRPGAKPINTSYDWLIMGGIIVVFIILAIIMRAFVDIQTARYLRFGLGIIMLLIAAVKWASSGKK